MGPYCNYCGRRCSLLRVIPDGARQGEYLLLATCERGMKHDQHATGHTHATAVNPYTDPDGARAAEAARARSRAVPWWAPGALRSQQLLAAQRNEAAGHQHDGGCTWAGCGPWGRDTSAEDGHVHDPLVNDSMPADEQNHPEGYRYCGTCLAPLPASEDEDDGELALAAVPDTLRELREPE